MEPVVVILGAGIAGRIAAKSLAYLNPIVFDAATPTGTGYDKHMAIMRLRDPALCSLLGCEFKTVDVWKAVVRRNSITETPNIRDNNLYSLKLYGRLGARSLTQLGWAKRHVITKMPHQTAEYGKKLVKIMDGGLVFADGGLVSYDICVSTIPMPAMIASTGSIVPDGVFDAKPVTVLTGHFPLCSDVNQTLYYPDPETPLYRASIEGQRFIIEIIGQPIDVELDLAVYRCQRTFGVKFPPVSSMKRTVQKLGKMSTMPDDSRKKTIINLTKKFNIYSFGRFAIWKPIRADHLIDDIDKIKRMINFHFGGDEYSTHLEQTTK